MLTVEGFSRLVAGIYAAAIAPQHWESTIRDVNRAIGGNGGALLTADRSIWSIQNSILPVGAATSYSEYYHRLDSPMAAVEKGAVGTIRTGTELVVPHRKSEFYADWLHPNGLEDGMFVRLSQGPHPACFLLHTDLSSEPFGTRERVRQFSGLVPHLQQALRARRTLDDVAHEDADLHAALDTVDHGIAVVGAGSQVLNLNAAAEAVLRAGDGLAVTSGRITAAHAPTNRTLSRALHSALTGTSDGIRAGFSFTAQRPSGERPFVIHVLPLHRQDEPDRRRALVVLIDPGHEAEPSSALLQRLYHLTRTEADIALRVAHGADPKHIAEDLSVSITTVRTHLHRVFDKTDTHRQVELVRLLLTLHPVA
ncbi:helix-turn-helix transcriptional regulator [Mycobacterium sp. TNTM28]|uniref:Helix-turn-helix transcriptional regulator n=1 Tax=[Mycobacterium] fortunisiensis TaxID=2600579 RepID=A0ABS6KUN3_9MYCO|nr:helix-turn-helix transcriptional regulator [[Mycobacterium] fortunisiensis]MBU9767293.1 helix-turn-helix transcriptional regulator [[Mycobacterium] fortunisiensis]